MSCSQKISLENAIFARADQLQMAVHARAGRLVSHAKDAYLQALLRAYNAFFYQENRQNYEAQENGLEGLKEFPFRFSRVPILSDKEYKFELIVGGKCA